MSHNNLGSGLLKGPKVGGRHTTVISDAQVVIVAAKQCPNVNRIIPGRVAHTGPGKKRIRFIPVLGGLRIRVRGATAVQNLFVQTDNPSQTQKLIEGVWYKSHGR